MSFVTRGGVRLHYEVEGTGPPLLLHTGAGGDLEIWRDAGYVRGLPEFRTILLDQRGRGASDRPEGVEAHRLEEYVADVAAVLDDAGIASVGFWGYSAGAVVGVAFGATYPARLQALVGTGTLPFRNFSDTPLGTTAEAAFTEMVAKGGVRADLEAHMNSSGERFPEAIERNVLAGDARMYAFSMVAWSSWSGPLGVYPKLRAPVLMVAGEKEDPKRQTEASIPRLAEARLVRLPGLGHLSAFARSDLVLPHVRPFLAGHLRDVGAGSG